MTSISMNFEQDTLIDKLLEGYHGGPKEILGKGGLLTGLQVGS